MWSWSDKSVCVPSKETANEEEIGKDSNKLHPTKINRRKILLPEDKDLRNREDLPAHAREAGIVLTKETDPMIETESLRKLREKR
jgi:hypothetical protein